MPCFYRLYKSNDLAKEADCVLEAAYRPSGNKGSLPFEWTFAMEEIPQTPPWPHCRVLRAPLIPPGFEQEYNMFTLRPGKEIPDIFCVSERLLVSARARAVLETSDDFGHEYIETEVQNTQRQRINEQAYYLLNVRRYLEIDALGGEVLNWKKMFVPKGHEKKFLPTLQQCPELMAKVAQLPLWRHRLEQSVVYLSAQILQTLRNAGITGLVEFSDCYGDPGDSVARFET